MFERKNIDDILGGRNKSAIFNEKIIVQDNSQVIQLVIMQYSVRQRANKSEYELMLIEKNKYMISRRRVKQLLARRQRKEYVLILKEKYMKAKRRLDQQWLNKQRKRNAELLDEKDRNVDIRLMRLRDSSRRRERVRKIYNELAEQ